MFVSESESEKFAAAATFSGLFCFLLFDNFFFFCRCKDLFISGERKTRPSSLVNVFWPPPLWACWWWSWSFSVWLVVADLVWGSAEELFVNLAEEAVELPLDVLAVSKTGNQVTMSGAFKSEGWSSFRWTILRLFSGLQLKSSLKRRKTIP